MSNYRLASNHEYFVRDLLRDYCAVYLAVAEQHVRCRRDGNISYTVVLERLPGPMDKAVWDFSDTIFPEGLEAVPPRFAISRRNEWMLKQSDFVVTYITHNWGGAAQYAEKAHRQGKRVLNLAENCKF